ncbi:hypothetical protein JDV02_007706 [Purpureocillium takamizusanense]|uniref:Uncharacterized protein n=1 Tax=Purpureocillium takamizusanense TaxID=2060973 RepID=A0A9Q8QM89_9HYPO|nr:uncharacterized protein JDV02_007706 [Purpureocillium takamizusanense]UNI21746.1 hypothetical protein JDV02_007706 [Purpureocillium takamizusanense]
MQMQLQLVRPCPSNPSTSHHLTTTPHLVVTAARRFLPNVVAVAAHRRRASLAPLLYPPPPSDDCLAVLDPGARNNPSPASAPAATLSHPSTRAPRPHARPPSRRRVADPAWTAKGTRHSTWPPPQAASRAYLDRVADSPSPGTDPRQGRCL